MSARVHLLNPSHISFGVAVITPRWLYVLAAATGTEWGDPIIVDESLDPIDVSTIAPGDVVGIGIHTGNARRGYEVGQTRARARRVGRVRRHSRHAVPRRSARAWAARTPSSRATATWSGAMWSATAWRASRSASTRAAAWRATSSCRRDGTCCPRTGTCGRRCRRCAAARNIVRSVPSGAPTARSRGSAASIAWCEEIVELRRLGFRFIALADDNFYPVTLDDLAHGAPPGGHDAAARARGSAPGTLRVDGAARAAARRHGVLHADHDGSRRRSGLSRRDAQGAHQGRARRRRIGHATKV